MKFRRTVDLLILSVFVADAFDKISLPICDYYKEICSSTEKQLEAYERRRDAGFELEDDITEVVNDHRVGFTFVSPPYASVINETNLWIKFEVDGYILPDEGYLLFNANRKAQPDDIPVVDGFECYNATSARGKYCSGAVYVSALTPGTHVLSVQMRFPQAIGEFAFHENHLMFEVVPPDDSGLGVKVLQQQRRFELKRPSSWEFPNSLSSEVAQLKIRVLKRLAGRKINLKIIGSWGFDGQKTIWKQIINKLDPTSYALEFVNMMNEAPPQGDQFFTILLNAGVEFSMGQLFLEREALDAAETVDNAIGILSKAVENCGQFSSIASIAKLVILEQICSHELWTIFTFCIPSWGREAVTTLHGLFAGGDGILFANSIQPSDGLLSAFFNLLNIPALYDLPNLDPKSTIIRHPPTHIVSPSHFARRLMLTKYDISEVVVIQPGIDLKRFVFNTTLRREVTADEKLVIGFLGRVETEKSLGLYLRMISYLYTRTNLCEEYECSFDVVGEGMMPKYLSFFAKLIDAEKNLHFKGPEYEDVGGVLSTFDILINPTLRSNSETFCIVNTEAMAVGVPVISFGSGGVMDYFVDNVNGLLVPSSEVSGAGLAKKVIEYINLSLEEKLELGMMGANLIRKKFSATKMVLKYEHLLLSSMAC